MKKLILMITTLALTGCANIPDAAQQAQQAELNRTVPICNDASDCATKWDAAQLWVIHHAGYKIQTANNVLIETYNPSNSSPNLAASVTKEPIGKGQYKILIQLWCDNMFGCIPNSYDSAIDFNKTVSSAIN